MKNCILFNLLLIISTGSIFAQPASWTPRGVGGGGAFFSPSVNPGNPSEFYISSDMSGLYHTTDFGLSYSLVHFQQFTGGVYSKICFTSSPGYLYAIAYINETGTPVKSIDNGQTWNTLPGNPDPYDEVYTIDVDYYNPGRMVISFYGSIYFSDNGGNTFSLVHSALNSGSGNLAGGVFFDNNNIYIGTNDGVIVSADGGSTWATATISGIPASEAIYSFAAGKSGNTVRFFCLTASSTDIYVGIQGGDYWNFMKGVYSCDYNSTGWTPKMNGITQGTDYPMYVLMAGNDINTAYLGGSNASGTPEILKTTDAGTNWVQKFLTQNNQNIITGYEGSGGDLNWTWGGCPLGIAICAQNPDYLIYGDYGFCHKTSDGGETWQQSYTDTIYQHPMNSPTPKYQDYRSAGLENTSCWQVTWLDQSTIWACFTDIRGIISHDGGLTWSFNYTGNTANTTYRVIKGSDGTIYAATSDIHDMYQSTRLQDAQLDANDQNGKILYSTDNGHTWQLVHDFGHPVFWITIDQNHPGRAYAGVVHFNNGSGTGGVYRCDDLNNLASSTWNLLPDPPRTEKHPACLTVLNDGKLVATFSGRRNSSGTFTASSGCFIYNPETGSWTDVSDPGMYYWTMDVVVDPGDVNQDTWYAGVFSGWGGAPNGLGGLYKTVNRGQSWIKLTGSAIDRVTSCTFNPADNNQVYITTETQGLWFCSNINDANPVFTVAGSYPFMHPERVYFNPYDPNDVWVTGFGCGLKEGSLNSGRVHDICNNNCISVFPNPASGIISIGTNLDSRCKVNICNLTGQIEGTVVLSSGSGRIDVSYLSEGVHFIRINDLYQKIVVIK